VALGGERASELTGIEGARLVETALRSDVEVSALLVSESGGRHLDRLQQWIPSTARLLRTTDRLFAYAAATETPQGIAALVRPVPATFDDLVRGIPLVLLMGRSAGPG